MHSPAHTDTAAGLLTRFRWRTRGPQLLSDQNTHCPGTPSMPSHGRRRQEHPVTQSLRHCAWCFPISGAAVQQAGGHGGRTQSEYSESSPSASGFARHCTPPRRPGPQPATLGPAGRCLGLATNGIRIKKKKRAKPGNGGERQAVAVCLSCGRVRRCHPRLWPGVRSLRERFALVHRVRQEGVPTWHAAHAVQHMRGKEPVRIVQGVRREYAQAASRKQEAKLTGIIIAMGMVAPKYQTHSAQRNSP